MQAWRFLLPPALAELPLNMLDLAWVRLDGTLSNAHFRRDSDLLIVEQPIRDEAVLRLSVPLAGYGQPNLLLGTLIPRDEPYHLVVELIRRQLNQAKELLAKFTRTSDAMRTIGISGLAPAMLEQTCNELTGEFRSLLFQEKMPSDASLELLTRILRLVDSIVAQRSRARVMSAYRADPKSKRGRFGFGVNSSDQLPFVLEQSPIIEFLRLNIDWRRLEPVAGAVDFSTLDRIEEEAARASIKALVGPILTLYEPDLPPWVVACFSDFRLLESMVVNHIEQVVEHYQSRVTEFTLASRLNSLSRIRWPIEWIYRLWHRMREAAVELAPSARFGLEVDDPWCDTFRATDGVRQPMHFLDQLMRLESKPDFVTLRLRFGDHIAASRQRTLGDLSAMLEQYHQFADRIDVAISFQRRKSAALPSDSWANDLVDVCLAKAFVGRVCWHPVVNDHSFDLDAGQGMIDQQDAEPIVWNNFVREMKSLVT